MAANSGLPSRAPAKPMMPAAMMMTGNGTAKKKIATNAAAAIDDHDPVAQRALADPHHRLDDDGEHRGLQAKEQRFHEADIAVGRVDVAERHDGDDAGQDEEPARHQAAGGAMQQPPDIGRKLLRFGPRQQHAVVQRVQEPAFRNPALLLDEDPVHDGDLPGRSAKAEDRDAEPDDKCFAEGNAVGVALPALLLYLR